MIEELIHYLHVAETIFSRSGTSPGTPIYNVVLQSLVNAKEVGILEFGTLFPLSFPIS